jgi:hypothetical protein
MKKGIWAEDIFGAGVSKSRMHELHSNEIGREENELFDIIPNTQQQKLQAQ